MDYIRSLKFTSLLFVLILVLCTAFAEAQIEAPAVFLKHVPIPAQDSTMLAASLALPDSTGTFPTVLIRTPYGSRRYQSTFENYIRRGYAVLMQDVRGRYDSGGDFVPFVNEVDDGDATLLWIRSQPWSNGVVVAEGHSYVGFTALYLTAGSEKPPKALFVRHPVASPVDGLYRGGAMLHHFNYYWAYLVDGKMQDLDHTVWLDWDRFFARLPICDAHAGLGRTIPFYEKWVDWADGSFGKDVLPDTDSLSADDTAILLVGGWFDLFGRNVIDLYLKLAEEQGGKSVKLIMGPFDHSMSPPKVTAMEFGDWSVLDIGSISRQWLDHWVAGEDNGVENLPPVQFYLLGENRWVSSESWPPKGADERIYYLHSNGSANTQFGDGALSTEKSGNERADSFIYDPANPVPTKGGCLCCLRQMTNAGPYDQNKIETRRDVLVYTGEALNASLTLAGPVSLDLFAATDAKDTDFTAKLVDVHPDGRAVNIIDGIVRARFRKGMTAPSFIKPCEITNYTIEFGHCAITLPKGHRLRLEVSSSNFPRFDRNMNTGGPVGRESIFRKALQTVYHDANHQSRLRITVAEKL